MTPATQALSRIVSADPGVAPSYRQHDKTLLSGEPIVTAHALYKWYEIFTPGRPIPDEVRRLALTHLTSGAVEARGLGFAMLHRCGESFYFLIACTWRGENELWSTVDHKANDAIPVFQPWPRDGAHKPNFCVWEMTAVTHETRAWRTFLESPRDDDAAQRWLSGRASGPA